jgi:nucleotidyltransferase/DNA polymerase involved in DNA repair
MGAPLFESRKLIKEKQVAVFSSNYHLYGNMSMRVMDTLRVLADDQLHRCVEVYSVDEAFINLNHLPLEALQPFAEKIRDVVVKWTGIPVSVGIAPSKVLSKVANRIAKKDKQKSQCVLVLDDDEKLQHALMSTDVSDLWGIGRRYARKLKDLYGVNTAWQLKHMPIEGVEWRILHFIERSFGKKENDCHYPDVWQACFYAAGIERGSSHIHSAGSGEVKKAEQRSIYLGCVSGVQWYRRTTLCV